MTTKELLPDGLEFFTAYETADRAGISYRQLDYWTREDVLWPRLRAQGSGSHRVFDAREVRVAQAVGELRELGASTQVCRVAAMHLRWMDEFSGRVFVARDGRMYREPVGACWSIDLG
jgi:hypothetical protein